MFSQLIRLGSRSSWGIWGLALGYFVFYIPYSALTKAVSQGLWDESTSVSGFELLPATAIATTGTIWLILTLVGGWRYLEYRQVGRFKVPIVRRTNVLSGVATAVIIATTTLSYTFHGISIVFALLMMRGGVLVIGSMLDLGFRRRVRAYSWVALTITMVAITVAFAEVGGYTMTVLAAINISCYLMGYLIRLGCMTRIAKDRQSHVNQRYFVQETLIASLALILVPALFAIFGRGALCLQLRAGFTTFMVSELVFPALLIGAFYACLYTFGSLIYLDRREHTFCIPLNRCSSLLSGVVAALALTLFWGQPPPTAQQLVAAGFLMTALLSLSAPAWTAARMRQRQRIYLFICGENTTRSAIAQAICNDEIARLFGVGDDGEHTPARALSAGIAARAGVPMSDSARLSLDRIGVPPGSHVARNVTKLLIDRAFAVFCMTNAQRQVLVERFPHAAAKIRMLNTEGDIPHAVEGPDGSHGLAELIRELVRKNLSVREASLA